MKRKDIVKINNEEVVLESQKEFSEFKRHYNKYNFMQENQINTWKAKLKEVGPDLIPEPTIRDVLIIINNLTLEMREGFRKVNERLDAHDLRFDRIEARLDRHEERMNKLEARMDEHWARMDEHWGIEN